MKKLLLLLWLLILFPALSGFAGARSNVSNPYIESVANDARQPLHAGDFLDVTLEGDAHCKAYFDIQGVARGIAMQEVSSGIYVGHYQVKPGENAVNAAVIGYLEKDGKTSLMFAPSPITLEGGPLPTPPPAPSPQVVTRISPGNNARVTLKRPSIYAMFDAAQNVNPQSIHFYLDGRNVTGNAATARTFAAYTPELSLAPGIHRVRVTGATESGQNFEENWSFSVILPSPHPNVNRIIVAHNAAGPFSVGQTILVVVVGPPHGTTVFSIGKTRNGIPMRETSTPGIYVGHYIFTNNDHFHNVAITGAMVTAQGKHLTAQALTRITLIHPFTVTFLSPRNGEIVPASFIISGKTAPNVDVTLTIKAEAPVIPGFYSVHEKPKIENLRSDGQGIFKMELSTIAYSGTHYQITAVARNARGITTAPITITVTQR